MNPTSGAGGRSATRELVEWVDYLREIGVRELCVGETGSPAAAPGALPAREEGTPPPTRPAAPPAPTRPVLAALAVFSGPGYPDPGARLQQIRDELGECSRCKLHATRNRIVFGVGDPRARLMFVGEGPGADEDARGEPFVGRAGKKLDEMISAIGLTRAEVYIANVVKCRPPKNRDPESDEIATCSPFLELQIEAIRPRVIVTLGAPAARTLLNTRVGITRLRGNWHSFRGIPVMPTYHPAYLLRAYTRENRLKVFEDLKAARARMDA
ncbi:MAG TPA: uracil-DNA glycosylase [Candidatus Polarisedimenticolaceae bacterium]|nr:uracil-DNA glycosylase [Candidatus Polarisedimenticolaceae bacterium]